MRLNKKLDLNALKAIGIELFVHNPVPIFGQVEIEGPTFCSSTLRLDTSLRIGAFGSLNAQTEIGHSHIGRYCSIAQRCFIGGDKHPTDWLSTSRLFYVPGFRQFNRVHEGRNVPVQPFHSTGELTLIGHDVLIANGAIVSRGVRIGDGAIVAAGSVVTQDVPDYAIVGGNPARVLRMRFPDATIERLQRARWWDYNVFDLPADMDYRQVDAFLDRFEALKPGLTPYQPRTLNRDNVEQFSLPA